ncbi:MAG: hypothetical protein L0Y58_15340 [Verrucomicrobia subdivision 3 bacterium]|nr:hypothetical protein [Limisphaerales bacterium]
MNRLTLSPRVGFNVSAKFSGVSLSSAPASSRATPDGNAYNYDDGYVLTDISGNFGGQTWNWGYDNSASQISGNTILFSRSTAADSSSRELDDDPLYGGELTYSRLLAVKGRTGFGLEVAANFLDISFDGTQTFTSDVTRVTDAYAFTPGTTPPGTTPGSGYQGSFSGPGFVIGATPVNSTTTVTPGVLLTDRQRYEANLWGFRLGPYAEFALSKRWHLGFSAGLALGLLDSEGSWSQTAGTSTTRGDGDEFNVLWGYYAGSTLSWKMSERWSLQAGAQFQGLSDGDQSFGGRNVDVEFGESIFVTLGLGYSF